MSARASTPTRYAWFVLGVLVALHGLNFADRYLFVIMMEPIKTDLQLTDTQLGLISGLGFSLVYGFAGIWVARLADVGNRRTLLACAVGAWSALTTLCGMAGNFFQLLLVRMGVGIAESGCSPPAHSLISDYFPSHRRGAAFAIYAVGLDVGMALGLALGGWLGSLYGWRVAFIAMGLPGIAFAVITRLVLREPARGAVDVNAPDATAYSFKEAITYFVKHRVLGACILGSSLFVFAGTAIDSWAPLFLTRVHGLSTDKVGVWVGTLGSCAGLVGSLAAGWIADKLSTRDRRWQLGVPLVGFSLMIPATLGFLFSNGGAMPVFYFCGTFFNAFYMAPTIAFMQASLPLRVRALGSAILLLGYNLIGTSGANFVIGRLSDVWSDSLGVDSVRYAMAMSLIAGAGGIACTVYAIVCSRRDVSIAREVITT